MMSEVVVTTGGGAISVSSFLVVFCRFDAFRSFLFGILWKWVVVDDFLVVGRTSLLVDGIPCNRDGLVGWIRGWTGSCVLR